MQKAMPKPPGPAPFSTPIYPRGYTTPPYLSLTRLEWTKLIMVLKSNTGKPVASWTAAA